MKMTLEQLCAKLKPLACELVDMPNGEFEPPAVLAKSLICFIMAIGTQMHGEERQRHINAMILAQANYLQTVLLAQPSNDDKVH